MKFLTYMAGVGAIAGLSLLTGCETTRNDVTAARSKVAREQQKLEDMKRDEARKVDKEYREAETSRVTNKPVVGDDINEGPREETHEANRKVDSARERIRNQEERV